MATNPPTKTVSDTSLQASEMNHSSARSVVIIDIDAFKDMPVIDIDALENSISTCAEPNISRLTIARRLCVATSTVDVPTQTKLLLIQRQYESTEHPSREVLRMRLASDVTKMHLKDGFCHFVLVSSDPFFGTLTEVIKKLNHSAYVHGYGVKPRDHTSVEFIKAFDTFLAYPDVVKPMENNELRTLRTRYAESLVYTILRLDSRHSKTVGAAIVPLLRDKHPELSPKLLEFLNYEDLADFACDLGWVKKQPRTVGDFELELTPSGRKKAEALAGTIEAKHSETEIKEKLKSTFREVLGIEMPEQRHRTQVFNTAHWLLAARENSGLTLVTLSYAVVEQIDSPYITQNVAYRLLFGLYRAGAFDYQQNAVNKNDPELMRVRIDPLRMDDAFVMNVIYMQKRYPILADSMASEISSAVYGTPDSAKKIEAMRNITASPSFDRGNLPRELEQF